MKRNIGKYIFLSVGIALISFAGYMIFGRTLSQAFNSAGYVVNKNYVYAITTPNHLAVIDTRNDQIVKKINIGSASYLNPVLAEDGRFFASYYKAFLGPVGDSIIMYDPKTETTVVKKCESGPNGIVPIKINGANKVFVANYRSYAKRGTSTSSISIFTGENLHPSSPIVLDDEYTLYYSMTASIDHTKLFALASDMGLNPKTFDKIKLYIIDPLHEKIIQTIDLDQYGGMNGRIIESIDGKIYYGPGFEFHGPGYNDHLSQHLFVLDSQDFHFLKKIPLTEPGPVSLVYYPNIDKLYVQGYVDGLKDYHIDIIDTKTDQLIKTLIVEGADGIYRVSKDKLYINMIYVPDDQRGFKVLDVTKDEIVGFIPGKFGGVSNIPLEWMMEGKP